MGTSGEVQLRFKLINDRPVISRSSFKRPATGNVQ
jgi:hypothetical protein